MRLRVALCAALLALAQSAPAGAVNQEAIFDLSGLPHQQRDAAAQALSIYDYDWSLCVGHYPHRVTVTISDVSPAAGTASWSEGHIVIDDQAADDLAFFQGVFLHEAGHVTDWCGLEDWMRSEIVRIVKAPNWPKIGEAFPTFFARAFSPQTGQSSEWPITRYWAKQIRTLMYPDAPRAWWLTKRHWAG